MASPQPQPFGVLLKRYRRARHLTQEALAGKVGYSPGYISLLERGERHPALTTLTVLADALELSPAERALWAPLARPETVRSTPPQIAARLPHPAGPQPPLVGR